MDEALQFFAELFRLEGEVERLARGDSQADFAARRVALDELFAEQMERGPEIAWQPSAMGGAEAVVTPRRLYALKHYRHYKAGDIFYAFSSEPRDSSRLRLFIAKAHPIELRVMASYDLCRACAAHGRVGEERCDACGGERWQPVDGMPLVPGGELIEERFVVEPPDPCHAAALRT